MMHTLGKGGGAHSPSLSVLSRACEKKNRIPRSDLSHSAPLADVVSMNDAMFFGDGESVICQEVEMRARWAT